jgi:hypothetical protein
MERSTERPARRRDDGKRADFAADEDGKLERVTDFDDDTPTNPRGSPDGVDWQKYCGEPPRPEGMDGLAVSPHLLVRHDTFAKLTSEQLRLKPGDWDDPRYRLMYAQRLIIDPGTVKTEKETEFVLIKPGKAGASRMVRFIKEWKGKGLESMVVDIEGKNAMIYWVTAEIKKRLADEGFEIVPYEGSLR